MLGQLPVHQPAIPFHHPLHDWAALADDWKAVGDDLQAVYSEVLDDQLLLDAMRETPHSAMEHLCEVRRRLEEELHRVLDLLDDEILDQVRVHVEELLCDEEASSRETHDQQMPLFDSGVNEKAG